MPRPKKEATETKKKEAVAKAVKAAVVKTAVEKAAEAKKEKVKKEVTKKVAKTAVKKAAEKTAEKKTAAKKTAPAKKTVKETIRTNIILQYAGMNVTYDDLIKNAKNKYQFDMGGDVSGIKSIDLYVKPDDGKVYFVTNKKIEGDYNL